MLLNLIRLIFILLITLDVNAQGSLQNADFKTVEQLEAQGLTEEQAKAQMLHDTKVYVTTDGLNKLLSEAITDGDIGGGVTELTTDGDLLYYNSGLDRLGIGLEGQILQVSSLGFPEWADAPSVSPTTTEGDLIIRGDTEDIRLPIGTAGKILTSNGTTATWEDAPISLPDQTGQSGEFLFTNGTTASWSRVDDRINLVKNNLLANGSFDSVGISAEYTITTDALVDLTSVAARTGEIAANNINMLNIEATNGDATPYDIKAVFTKSQDFEGKQMLAFCEVKTLRPDVFFIVGANGVEQSRREVIADGSWRYYEIPFVGGDTSQYIEINGETTASEEAISVDNCFMGKVSPDYLARISGAQYVGGLTAQGATNCQWSVTSATFATFPADADCNTFTASGNIKAPTTKVPGLIIPAGSQVGRYKINAKLGFRSPTTLGGACRYRLTNSNNLKTFVISGSQGSSTYDPIVNGEASFDVNITDTSADVLLQLEVQAGSGACQIYEGNTSGYGGFEVYYFPDSTNTIVTQNTELTAQSANEFVATVSNTGVVVRQNFPWINGSCTNAIPMVCTFNTGIFEQIPVCNATMEKTNGGEVSIVTSLSGITIYRHNSAGTAEASHGFQLNCTRSTDYRKHATIVGKFENINSSELVKVEASGNGGQAITANVTNITWSTETVDNYNAWNGTTFTAPKDSYYLVNGGIAMTTTTNYASLVYINSTFAFRCGQTYGSSSGYTTIPCVVKLSKNDVMSFRSTATLTLDNSVNHRISITELPDTESIIKNLSTQKTKCQTKFLSANVTTDTTLSDLGFNGLLIGKKYRIYYNFKSNRAGGYDNVILNIRHNSSSILQPTHSYDGATSNGHVFSTSGISDIFTAVSSEVDVLSASVAAGTTIEGNGTTLQTWVQLCELPDTYVETTEW